MRLTAFAIIVFFIAMNISLGIIQISRVLPQDKTIPTTTAPQDITTMLIHVDLSTGNLIIGGAALAVGAFLGWFMGNLILGGTVAIIFFGLDLFIPIGKWVIFGLPSFIGDMVGTAGADATTTATLSAITFGLTALMAAVWFWFFLGLIMQRPLEMD